MHSFPPYGDADLSNYRAASSPRQQVAWLLYGLATIGTIVFLAGNLLAAGWFAALVVGILCPAAALLARLPACSGLPGADRSILCMILVILVAPAWFYLRRSMPWPAAADATMVAILWGTVCWSRALVSWRDDLREAMAGLTPALPFACLPLTFASVWLGFAAPRPDGIGFYGLFPVDFCNLASVVSMIHVGEWLPPSTVVGAGDMHYHWPYFALPALLVEIAGDSMRVTNALALCNMLPAFLLMLAIAQLVRTSTRADRSPATVSLATGTVLFAPLITYAYQIVAHRLHAPWLQWGPRNGNMLSLLNSMVTFGGSTTALVMVVAAIQLLRHWNDARRISHGILFCMLLVLLPAFSSTLAPPLALALACWFVIGGVRHPGAAAAIAAPIAVVGVFFLQAIHVLGGDQHLGFGFDGGMFLVTFGLSSAPLWVPALLAGHTTWRLDFWCLLVIAGFAWPSFVRTSGPGTTPSDLSMKTASLMVVAMAPLLALGLDGLLRSWRSFGWRHGLAGAAICLGLTNSAVYTAQFVAARMLRINGKVQVIPSGYGALLDRVRTISRPSAVVLDGVGIDMPFTLWPVSLAERRVLVPSAWWNQICLADIPENAGDIPARVERFRKWRDEGYPAGYDSQEFAGEADYLVIPTGFDPGPSWKAEMATGGYSLYRARGGP